MSTVEDLSYDIEQLYIEGLNPKSIARQLECDLDTVLLWLERNSLAEEDFSPHNTVNS